MRDKRRFPDRSSPPGAGRRCASAAPWKTHVPADRSTRPGSRRSRNASNRRTLAGRRRRQTGRANPARAVAPWPPQPTARAVGIELASQCRHDLAIFLITPTTNVCSQPPGKSSPSRNAVRTLAALRAAQYNDWLAACALTRAMNAASAGRSSGTAGRTSMIRRHHARGRGKRIQRMPRPPVPPEPQNADAAVADLPAEFVASGREKFALFIETARAAGGETLVLCHSDADGLTTGAILTLALRRAGLTVRVEVTGKGGSAWSDDTVALLEKHRPSALIVGDLGVRAEPVSPTGVPTFFIDHHRPSGLPPDAETHVVTGYGLDPTPTSGLIAFACVGGLPGVNVDDLDWIAAISVLGDIGDKAPFAVLASAKKRYGAGVLRDATTLLNAPRRSATGDASGALALLLSVVAPARDQRRHPPRVRRPAPRQGGSPRRHDRGQEGRAEVRRTRRRHPHPHALPGASARRANLEDAPAENDRHGRQHGLPARVGAFQRAMRQGDEPPRFLPRAPARGGGFALVRPGTRPGGWGRVADGGVEHVCARTRLRPRNAGARHARPGPHRRPAIPSSPNCYEKEVHRPSLRPFRLPPLPQRPPCFPASASRCSCSASRASKAAIPAAGRKIRTCAPPSNTCTGCLLT